MVSKIFLSFLFITSSLAFEEIPVKDERKELKMTKEMANFQLHSMRSSLDVVSNFILAYQKMNYERLLSEAKKLGPDGNKKNLSQAIIKMNPEFKGMAKGHQMSVKKLISYIEKKDQKKILPQFGKVIKTCVQCHSVYKTTIVP